MARGIPADFGAGPPRRGGIMNELPVCPQCHFWPMSVKHLEKWSMTPITFRCGRCGVEPRPRRRILDVRGAQKIAAAGLRISRRP